MTARLCLTMIVKDEAPIIERCLAAAAPWIASYAVHDTGSSDGTPELVEAFFAGRGIPGRVTRGSFVDFATARNASLDAALEGTADHPADYLLLCDADMELVVEDADFRAALHAPAYLLTQQTGSFRYANVRLVRSDVRGRYRGVTHEYLDLDGAERASLAGVRFVDHAEGSSRTVKHERDLALLLEGSAAEPDNARYTFYLAQTYRELGRLDEALATYCRRVEQDGWDEEVWYSLLQVALLRERLDHDDAAVVGAYLRAYQARPTRAETLVELARYLREHGSRHHLAHLFASRALSLDPPEDLLFVSADAYGWRARDELSVAAYWVGRFEESAQLAAAVLEDPLLPAEHRTRVQENLAHAQRRLG